MEPEAESRSRGNLRILRLYLVETGKEIKQRKLNFCLGSCSVFIVVLVIALLLTVLANAPVLYLSLAQQQNGEVDLLMVNRDRLMDFEVANTTARASVGGISNTYGCPRLDWDVILRTAWRCSNYTGDPYTSNCSDVLGTTGVAYAIHDAAERRAGVGREWSRSGFNSTDGIPAGGVFLSSSLASSMGARAEDTVLLTVRMELLLTATVWQNMTADLPPQPNTAIISFKVIGVYSGGGGKHESSVLGLVIDGSTLFSLLADNLHPSSSSQLPPRLRALVWTRRATSIVWNLPPLRVNYYLSTDLTQIQTSVSAFLSSLLFAVSWNDVETSLPVLAAVSGYSFFSLFLGLILNIIVVFIFFLSVLLIYSLLMVSVEARTFELGVLRMVGMTRARLAGLVLTQALFFAVPGIALGLPVAQALAILFARFLSNIAQIQVSPLLSPVGICVALLAGFLVPVLASLLPIRAALQKNVWDSVDTRRSKTKAVEYKLSRNETDRPSLKLLVVGAVLVGLGFVIYYLLPLSLVSSNIYLLLNIFFLLLILMLIGLVVLASNLQPLLEHLFMWLLFFWDKPAVRSVARRNFDAHRRRNAKTAIMFAVSLAFIIFLQVVFSSQINTLIAQTNQRRASTLSVRLSRGNFLLGVPPGPGLPVAALERYARSQPLISDLGWVSMPAEWQAAALLDASAAPLGRLSAIPQNLVGLSPNFFNASFSGFTVVDSSTDPYPPSPALLAERVLERLYSRRGSHGVAVGSKYAPQLGAPGPSFRPRDLLVTLVTAREQEVLLAALGTTSTNTSTLT